MGRQNQFSATLVVGNRDLGLWAALEGGEMDADDNLHYPGAMTPPVSLGSVSNVGNVTLRKLEADLTDDDLAFLIDVQGTPTLGVATKQRLNAANQSTRRPLAYRGTVKTVTPATYDSTSNDAAQIEVVLTVTGKPTLA